MKSMLTFLKHVCACELGQFVPCDLTSGEYEGVRTDPWEVGSPKFDSSWRSCHHNVEMVI
jgi:hypothetical protein